LGLERYGRNVASPLSIRFEPGLLERLRAKAAAMPGASVSGLAQRLVDEGLRIGDHPGIMFRDGPSGRRAGLACGPDVWEIIKVLREVDERGPAAAAATAEIMNLPEVRVRSAIRYYTAYPDEIDREITQADTESRAAEAAWEAEQRLLA
jgi:hypothetical protein